MKCMKCGVSIQSGQVFCQDCLTDMANHPVRQDAPLILPQREKQTAQKRSRKRIRKPEEQISHLRKVVAALLMTVVVLCVALTISVYLLLQSGTAEQSYQQPGQNYGTSESVE